MLISTNARLHFRQGAQKTGSDADLLTLDNRRAGTTLLQCGNATASRYSSPSLGVSSLDLGRSPERPFFRLLSPPPTSLHEERVGRARSSWSVGLPRGAGQALGHTDAVSAPPLDPSASIAPCAQMHHHRASRAQRDPVQRFDGAIPRQRELHGAQGPREDENS